VYIIYMCVRGGGIYIRLSRREFKLQPPRSFKKVELCIVYIYMGGGYTYGCLEESLSYRRRAISAEVSCVHYIYVSG